MLSCLFGDGASQSSLEGSSTKGIAFISSWAFYAQLKPFSSTRLASLLTFCNGHNNRQPGSEDKLSVAHKAARDRQALKEGRMKFNEPGKDSGTGNVKVSPL